MVHTDVSERILAFRVDDGCSDLSFVRRLAIENGWSRGFAERAFEEYKRFLVLCYESGRLVTPSDVVDEVWHLHLCYTRSYWRDLCRDAIGREIHHDPTVGGAAEDAKFLDAYETTRIRYERRFGEAPDPRFWPPSEQRFRPISRIVKVDRDRYVTIPRRAMSLVVALAVLLAVPACSSGEISLLVLLGLALIGLSVLVRKEVGAGTIAVAATSSGDVRWETAAGAIRADAEEGAAAAGGVGGAERALFARCASQLPS